MKFLYIALLCITIALTGCDKNKQETDVQSNSIRIIVLVNETPEFMVKHIKFIESQGWQFICAWHANSRSTYYFRRYLQ